MANKYTSSSITNNHPADLILSRLDKVKCNSGKWMACCPAHQDKTPSLSVREATDGRILLHCFAGCHYEDVLAAIGLEPKHLFPNTDASAPYAPISDWKRQRYESALQYQQLLIAMVDNDRKQGITVSPEDEIAYQQAVVRARKISHALTQEGHV